MIRTLVLLVSMPVIVFAEFSLESNYFYSWDSDDASQTKITMGADYHFNATDQLGIHAGTWSFNQLPGSNSYKIYLAKGKFHLGDFTSFSCEYMDREGAGFHTLQMTSKPKNWYLDGSYEHSFVDSYLGLEENITVDTYSLSVDYILNPSWTVAAQVMPRNYSDGNDLLRKGFRVIYSSQRFTGFNVQLKLGRTEADFNPVEYFSPEKWDRHFIIFGYIKRFHNEQFQLRTYAGPGIQIINDGEVESIIDWNISLKGNISDRMWVSLQNICTNDGGDYEYRWCSIGGTLQYMW